MSWFLLGDISGKERRKIKGIWLRKNANPDIIKEIKKTKNLRGLDRVWKIEIVELRKNNQVLLEVWANNALDLMRDKERNNVFWILMTQNPKWVCEGDLGKGEKIKF